MFHPTRTYQNVMSYLIGFKQSSSFVIVVRPTMFKTYFLGNKKDIKLTSINH